MHSYQVKVILCYFLIDFTPFKPVNPLRHKLFVGVKELDTKEREQKENSSRQWIDVPVTYLNIKFGMEARSWKGVPHERIARKEKIAYNLQVHVASSKVN